MSDKHKDIDAFLNGLLNEDGKPNFYPLQDLFEQKLADKDITKNQALNILGIDHKTLSSILKGDSKKIDAVNIHKLADFLVIPYNDIVQKYFELISNTDQESIALSKKRSFIVNNFNIASLKKIGLIDTISDFDHIENRINSFLGYDSIFEHQKHIITAAFSTGKRKTNKENLSLWYAAACQSLEKTHNPYEYDRDALKDFFPKIRWHSMNIENGLLEVAQALFKLGITLIIVPKLTTDLHVRGATLEFRDKPCIVLTKYTKFYATMWFALLHELFHVLYDWEEIRNHRYHISGETESMKINESEADNFARQYLFSDEKMNIVKSHINEPRYVKYFAEQNHVHESIIYSFYSWDNSEDGTYGKFDKYACPAFDNLLQNFNASEFLEFTPVKEISKKRNVKIYNI
jgi:Zn-dependent peptidase ImmA (M78 family)/DNA-binding Xre family transcriptional regulator